MGFLLAVFLLADCGDSVEGAADARLHSRHHVQESDYSYQAILHGGIPGLNLDQYEIRLLAEFAGKRYSSRVEPKFWLGLKILVLRFGEDKVREALAKRTWPFMRIEPKWVAVLCESLGELAFASLNRSRSLHRIDFPRALSIVKDQANGHGSKQGVESAINVFRAAVMLQRQGYTILDIHRSVEHAEFDIEVLDPAGKSAIIEVKTSLQLNDSTRFQFEKLKEFKSGIRRIEYRVDRVIVLGLRGVSDWLMLELRSAFVGIEFEVLELPAF